MTLINYFFKVYLDRYQETKLMLINGGGDEFFLPGN